MLDAIKGLFKSRKFVVLLFDVVITLLIYFVGKYAELAAEDLKIIIAAIQPVFLIIIAGIAWEDASMKRAGIFPKHVMTYVVTSPMTGLLRSRKFWTGILDMVISLVLFFTAKYLLASIADDIHFVIMSLQPVFLMLIAGIAWEDSAAKKAGLISFQ